jgi:2-furoyl-CoA dehydrogenase large subunit
VRNLRIRNRVVLTNKTPSGLVRGFGGPQVYFALERLMQRIAVRLGLDPLEVIRRNLVDRFPYRCPAGGVLDSGNYRGGVDHVIEAGGPKDGAQVAATVAFDPLGGVSVIIDSLPQGQGHRTVTAQVAAHVFGLDRLRSGSKPRSIPARTPGRSLPGITRAGSPERSPEPPISRHCASRTNLPGLPRRN